MRLWIVAISLLLGVLLGLGMTWAEFRTVRWAGSIDAAGPAVDSATNLNPADRARQPIARVFEDTYDFSYMELGTERSHDFTIANDGQAPLRLTKGETTCKCTMSSLAKAGGQVDVPPGGQENITLTWNAKGSSGPFRQSAEIFTSDPQLPLVRLTVKGDVVQSVTVIPQEIVFTSLSPSAGATARVQVCSVGTEPIRIVGHAFQDASTAEHFTVTYGEMAVDQLKVPNAKSGCLVTVTLKPGLPLGTIQQTITFETNLSAVPQVILPVSANVVADISIVGRGWNSSKAVLAIGKVDRAQGAERTLKLLVRGPDRNTVAFEIEHVEPKLLQVTLGERKEMASGTVTQTPLSIVIPKGSPESDHLGSTVAPYARIRLKSTHPEAKSIDVKIQFSIEEN